MLFLAMNCWFFFPQFKSDVPKNCKHKANTNSHILLETTKGTTVKQLYRRWNFWDKRRVGKIFIYLFLKSTFVHYLQKEISNSECWTRQAGYLAWSVTRAGKQWTGGNVTFITGCQWVSQSETYLSHRWKSQGSYNVQHAQRRNSVVWCTDSTKEKLQ